MTVALPEGVEVDQSARVRGGLLASALAAPDGWQRGLAIPFYGCGEPILRDKCVIAEDEAHRPDVVEFAPFPIEQGSTCSTLSGIDHVDHATGRLDATTEWAMGRQLATDQAATGSPSFADGVHLGTVTATDPDQDVTTAVSCLIASAVETGFGSRFFLHAPSQAVPWLAARRLVNTPISPAGAELPWVISPGYPTPSATAIRLWVTGPVWAAVDNPQVVEDVDWRQNSESAWALRAGIVAFDPCINFSIDITVPTCPTAG